MMVKDSGDTRFLSESIPYTFFMLPQNEPKIYERTIDVFLSLFPNTVGIEVTVSDTSIDMKIVPFIFFKNLNILG